MAIRQVFRTKNERPFYEGIDVEFQYYSGFSITQKQKSLKSLHDEFGKKYDANILEISSKSPEKIGYELSAFNLLVNTKDGSKHIENVFQGGKEFEYGGPFLDLLNVSPADAKRDNRLKESGNLVAFHFEGETFPLEPKDYFYNWIYSKALYEALNRFEALFEYDAFTDIEFNSKKSINCQARTVAIFVGLKRAGLLDEAMKSKESYLKIVYGFEKAEKFEQMSLFG